MRTGIAVAVALVALAAALIFEAPASLLDARLAAISQGRVRIADAEGTLWRGSGELVLSASGIRRPVSWQIDGWPLLRGELRGSFTDPTGAQSIGGFDAGGDRFELHGIDLGLPMDALLRALGAPSFLAAVGGQVTLHVERFARGPDALDAQVAAQWSNASVPGPRDDRIALGDVRAELSGIGHEVPGTITNEGGEVAIQGTFGAAADGSGRIDIEVTPREGVGRERAAAIADTLGLIGSPNGKGGYRLAWAGRPR
jgi:general secretion pathway protein N